jgi:hypothetical protein
VSQCYTREILIMALEGFKENDPPPTGYYLNPLLINDQLDPQFHLYVYFSSLHASSNFVLIIRRVNCNNTTCSISHCDRLVCGLSPQTRRSPTRNEIYRMLCLYNWISWWWARSCWKHVENWNKYVQKIVRQVGYLPEMFIVFSVRCDFWKSHNIEGATYPRVPAVPELIEMLQ